MVAPGRVPPPPDPGARRSLRARLAAGPLARRVALVDLRLYRLLRGRAQVSALEGPVRRFSQLGEHAALWVALGAGGAALDRRRRRRWGRAVGAIAGSYVANTAVKQVVRRRRPQLEGLPALVGTPTSLSFPSSHACSSFAAARAYAPLLPAPPLYAIASAMALSRVYLGVHYPSDIAVGAALGHFMGSAGR
jgi:membrane-associated phospholipid phosphatase